MSKTDYSYFVGTWKNSNGSALGIDVFSIKEGDLGPLFTASGTESGYFPGNWGTAPVEFLVSHPDSNTASAFQVNFEVGGREIFLAGNINKGLIIIATYAVAQSGSELPNLFTREFYYKQ